MVNFEMKYEWNSNNILTAKQFLTDFSKAYSDRQKTNRTLQTNESAPRWLFPGVKTTPRIVF